MVSDAVISSRLMRDTDDGRGEPVSRVLWITGMSGVGKSTLARASVAHLRQVGHAAVLLDGDELRAALGPQVAGVSAFDRNARLGLALAYGRLCKLIADQGVIVVVATISMFREVYAWNRANLPGYVEVYLPGDLADLRRRDPKGLYSAHARGELVDVAGLDLAVEPPSAADLVVPDFARCPADEIAAELIAKLFAWEATWPQ